MFRRIAPRHLLAALLAPVLFAPLMAQEKADAGKPKVHFLKPQGTYTDLAEQGFNPAMLFTGGQKPKPFFPLLEALHDFAANKEAKTLLLDLTGDPAFNMPQLRELERAFAAVRAAGKKVIAYAEGMNSVDLQLAACADKVLMPEMGAVDMRSPAMTVMHLKDALDLLGVQAEVTRVGDYKGAVEPYTLSQMSDHLREHYRAMLVTMNDDVVRRIATGRKLDAAKVKELQGQRLFDAAAAKRAGLVDALTPWDGADRAIAGELGVPAVELVDAAPKKKAKNRDIMAIFAEMIRPKKDVELEDTPQIVVLHLAGQIVDGDKPQPGMMVSGPSVKLIDKLANSPSVKGVVVRINSPGGSATASEAIRRALERLAGSKPVVMSMGELAASGGYWITTIGRPIFAEVGTITGSIGVFGMRFNTGALMRRLGVHSEIVALDEGATMDAADRPWTDAARARMQHLVDDIYTRFLANVAASRRLAVGDVDKIAGGRVWSGQQAVERKLVDAIGGLDDALAMVEKEAKVPTDVEVVHLPEARGFADSLIESMFDARLQAFDRSTLALAIRSLGRADSLLALLDQALQGDGKAVIWALDPTVLQLK
jgi:protease-4